MASKWERQINEFEYCNSLKSIYGRKIVLIFAAPIVNDDNQEELIELTCVWIRRWQNLKLGDFSFIFQKFSHLNTFLNKNTNFKKMNIF